MSPIDISHIVLRIIKPLALRECVYRSLFLGTTPVQPELCKVVELEFAPGIYLNVNARDPSHREMATLGYTQRKLSKMLRDMCLQGRMFLDIGANYGYFTCLWAGANPANRVLAFEPDPHNFESLKNNIEKNRLSGQVELASCAVGREYGTMLFNQGLEERTGLGRLVMKKNQGTISVEVVALDEYMEERLLDAQAVHVMKIAAGGAEAWVFQGAAKLLGSRKIKNIFFWENPIGAQALGIGPLEAQKELHANGYTLERLGSRLWHAHM